MIVSCDCPHCKKPIFASISVEFEERACKDESELRDYVMENIEITKTDTFEEILRMVKPHITPGMPISGHTRVLKNAFGLSEKCCRTFITRLMADRTRI